MKKEQIEKKYKIYNVLFIIMLTVIIAVVAIFFVNVVYSYFFGAEPSNLCGFLSGGCEREFGKSALYSSILSWTVLLIFGFPFYGTFLILFMIVLLKREKYKKLKNVN